MKEDLIKRWEEVYRNSKQAKEIREYDALKAKYKKQEMELRKALANYLWGD